MLADIGHGAIAAVVAAIGVIIAASIPVMMRLTQRQVANGAKATNAMLDLRLSLQHEEIEALKARMTRLEDGPGKPTA